MKSGVTPLSWIQNKAREIVHLKDGPRAIALGFAIGVFMGFVPLWGFKTLLALGLARLFRSSVMAAAIAVTLHDITLPLTPLLLRWEYDIGYWLLSRPHELPAQLHFHQSAPGAWFRWSNLFTVGKPLLLGSVAMGAPVALVCYGVAFVFLRRKDP